MVSQAVANFCVFPVKSYLFRKNIFYGIFFLLKGNLIPNVFFPFNSSICWHEKSKSNVYFRRPESETLYNPKNRNYQGYLNSVDWNEHQISILTGQ